MNKIKKLINKIEVENKGRVLSTTDQRKFVNEVLKINIKLEKIILKNSKINPILLCEKLLLDLLNYIKNFKNQKKRKLKKYKQEKHHQYIFQQLWPRYNKIQYKKFRIDRYTYRLKINKLEKIIYKKKCVDFGCGHGNFLVAIYKKGAKECLGLDYGRKNIFYANKIIKKLNLDSRKIKFKVKNVYKTNLKKNYYDFAIQNGVFHHLDNEDKAYREIYSVMKKSAYLWVYTDGGGGLRDLITDMSQRILRNISRRLIFKVILSKKLGINKSYHFSDNLTATYRHHTYESIKKKLSKLGFENFKQLKGGYKTDFDKPYCKINFFKEKFGSGDLRILCQKK